MEGAATTTAPPAAASPTAEALQMDAEDDHTGKEDAPVAATASNRSLRAALGSWRPQMPQNMPVAAAAAAAVGSLLVVGTLGMLLPGRRKRQQRTAKTGAAPNRRAADGHRSQANRSGKVKPQGEAQPQAPVAAAAAAAAAAGEQASQAAGKRHRRPRAKTPVTTNTDQQASAGKGADGPAPAPAAHKVLRVCITPTESADAAAGCLKLGLQVLCQGDQSPTSQAAASPKAEAAAPGADVGDAALPDSASKQQRGNPDQTSQKTPQPKTVNFAEPVATGSASATPAEPQPSAAPDAPAAPAGAAPQAEATEPGPGDSASSQQQPAGGAGAAPGPPPGETGGRAGSSLAAPRPPSSSGSAAPPQFKVIDLLREQIHLKKKNEQLKKRLKAQESRKPGGPAVDDEDGGEIEAADDDRRQVQDGHGDGGAPAPASGKPTSASGGSGKPAPASMEELMKQLHSYRAENEALAHKVANQLEEVRKENASLMDAWHRSQAKLAAVQEDHAALLGELNSIKGGGGNSTPTNGSELGKLKDALGGPPVARSTYSDAGSVVSLSSTIRGAFSTYGVAGQPDVPQRPAGHIGKGSSSWKLFGWRSAPPKGAPGADGVGEGRGAAGPGGGGARVELAGSLAAVRSGGSSQDVVTLLDSWGAS